MKAEDIWSVIIVLYTVFCGYWYEKYKVSTSFVNPRSLTEAHNNKTGINFMILSLNSWKIVFNTMLYMIYQYGWEWVLIHRILLFFLTGFNQPDINWFWSHTGKKFERIEWGLERAELFISSCLCLRAVLNCLRHKDGPSDQALISYCMI